MLRLSCVIICLLHAVCIEALCSDASHCSNCTKGMQPVCFLRQCRCFGTPVPNECYSPSDCVSVCILGTVAVCPDGHCYCRLG